ncbi:MAG TPA: glycoside hydrolase family 3 C-terminal domain-containing protein, partial [Chitinophagaceae bacterium]|nr:glycoside hydrolase family 3 C-terminal domain-containing protein [Chitinophagaceae bacterium]
YKFCNEAREKEQWNNPAHLDAEKDMARKSIVLLKNENQLLPLKKAEGQKKIALIGPLVRSIKEHLGFWSYDWPDDSTRITSLWDEVQKKVGGDKLLYAKGCNINDSSKAGFDEAIAIAKNADIVIMSVGEARDMTGEAKSKSNIHLPGVQEELIKAITATGKPVVVMISAGRPLVFNWTVDNVPAILYTWWLGTKGAEAIADVLFGDYNPSGKLPMSFPGTEGQIPIYYNYYNTGRPATSDSDRFYRSAYIDFSIYPKFAFGHGLSYTNFNYSSVTLSSKSLKGNQKLTASVIVTNTGKYDGTEVVQLYIRDMVGSVVRPVKELKGFQKIILKAGESKTVSFTITTDDLKFYNNDLKYDWESGEFEIMIGTSSKDVKTAKLTWNK